MRAGNKSVFSLNLRMLAAIAAALASSAAIAQQAVAGGTGLAVRSGGWYSGLFVGRLESGIGDSMPPLTGTAPPNLPLNETNTGFKLFGGYQFSPNFALEGRLTDFGKFDAMRDDTAPLIGTRSGDIRSAGFRLDAVGIVPLQGGFALFGKIGTLYTPTRNFISTGSAPLPGPSFTDPNARLYEWNTRYGLGASYDVSSSIGLHFKYERASNYFGDARLTDGNVGIWSLGLIKRY